MIYSRSGKAASITLIGTISKMSKDIREAGVGDMKGMDYKNFRNWMNGKNGKDRLIGESAMKGMQHFVEHWEGN